MEKIKDKDTFSNVFYNATRRKRNILRNERKLNPPDLPPLHFYQRQSIKRPKIAPFSRNLFIQNPIPPKGTKFLDTRRAFPLVSPPRKNRKQSSIRPVSTCSLTERSLRGQTADSCGTGCWFSGHVFRLARNPESWLDSTNGYGATGVPDGLLCHVRRFQFSFPDPVRSILAN